MAKKILITGGNGFIAKSLYEYFTNCYFSPLEANIVAPNRDELDLLDSSKVFDFIRKHKFDVVIHTATYDAVPGFSKKDESLVLENNLKMFFNIAEHRAYFGKMIYFGSGAEAGRENWVSKMSEEYIESKVPKDQYGYSKYTMNQYVNKNSNNIYNLRLFGVFGKFDDWRYRFISNACCKAMLDMPITINKRARFDYLYIEDLTRIVKWFAENKPKRNTYNICRGEVYTYSELAEKVIAASSKDLGIIIKDNDMKKEYSGDNSLFLNEIENFEFTPIEESIGALYKWYDSNKRVIDKELFEY